MGRKPRSDFKDSDCVTVHDKTRIYFLFLEVSCTDVLRVAHHSCTISPDVVPRESKFSSDDRVFVDPLSLRGRRLHREKFSSSSLTYHLFWLTKNSNWQNTSRNLTLSSRSKVWGGPGIRRHTYIVRKTERPGVKGSTHILPQSTRKSTWSIRRYF